MVSRPGHSFGRLRDRWGASTFGRADSRNELRVLTAGHPGPPVLLAVGRMARPVRKFPGVGWVVGDPALARKILIDGSTFTMIGEGGVGHLWSQVLGDWVDELFDGPGHHELRAQVRELFTVRLSADTVRRATADRLARMTAELVGGGTVDAAVVARSMVGRIVCDLLGLAPTAVPESVSGFSAADARAAGDDGEYLAVFAAAERLASLAIGTGRSTVLDPATVRAGSDLVAALTSGVPHAYATGLAGKMLGRCRELGVDPLHAKGLAALLVVAGTGTAASGMTRTVALLHDSGEQHRLLADPGLVPDAVREGLRVSSPAPIIGRSVARDVQLAGRQLRRGEQVKLIIWAMNNAAGRFSLDRGYLPENRQLWFGAGRHLCLGAQLARRESAALLEALLACGRPVEVVSRRASRNVLIPSYASLRIRLG